MSLLTDIVVVGGGPAGSLTASLLAAEGREVVLLEEHNEIGKPEHCAGIVSDAFLSRIPIAAPVVNAIKHAQVVFPGGKVLELERSSPFGYMVNRKDLDRQLAEHAVDHGVDLRLGVCFNTAIHSPDKITVVTNNNEIEADLLIGADGQRSAVAGTIGAGYSNHYLIGAQVDLPIPPESDDSMVLSIGNNVAPGFFAWKLPYGDKTRYGLCVAGGRGNPVAYLKALVKKDGLDYDMDHAAHFGGTIPVGYRTATVGDRTLLIGDAASQVKPVSGGGLAPISQVAPILCDTVREAYETNLFTPAVLGHYEVEWKRELGKTIERGMKMRKLFCGLSDRRMDEVGEIFDTEEIISYLSSIDIDNPAGIVGPILSQKGVKRKMMSTFLKAKLCKK